MKWSIFTALMIAITAISPSPSAHAKDEPVILGQVNLSFYAVVGGVIQEILEDKGYTVQVIEGPHAEIFPQLGAGDIDMLAAAWLPSGHGALYEPVQDVTFEIAPLYEDAAFFWAVPTYIPESAVRSIADLTTPDVVDLMAPTIVSLPEATGLTAGGRRVMAAYDLEAAGYELIAAAPSQWLATFRDAIDREDWFVFPLWQPQWINAAYDLRPLEEPLNAYGAPDTAFLIGHQKLREKIDAETLAELTRIRFEVADVTEMDRLVNVEGMSPRIAARSWMQSHPDKVRAWAAQ